jgi:Fic family protein
MCGTFNDGNGRVGRLLIILQLMQQGLLSGPLIYPSVYFERTRQEYYQRLQDVRTRGSWNEWIAYFTRGIQESCQDTINFTQIILQLRMELQRQIGSVRKRASLNEVLSAFFMDPLQTQTQLIASTHLAWNTIQAALADLAELGIISEISGKQRNRVYACAPLLDAIYSGFRSPADKSDVLGAMTGPGRTLIDTRPLGNTDLNY